VWYPFNVLTGSTSNSLKFTPAHGKIRINTRLISPLNLQTTPISLQQSSSQPFLTSGEHQTPFISPSPILTGSKWEETGDRLIVRIEVMDNGVGISPMDVKERRLFSPYAQAGLGRLQGGSGSGLGLSLVRRIVKLMGGRMGVDSLVSTVA
jgi:osomolarity two-component system sensor histidine kinase SLN1